MDESVRHPKRSAVPRALIGTIVLIVVIEFRLGHWDLHLLDLGAANHRFPGTVLHEASRAEILCFGDSLVKQGVAPGVLERKLGKSAYNLAIGGGTPAATYCLFRQAVEAGARPAAVVVDFEPLMISIGANHSENLLAETGSLRDCFEVGWNYRSSDFFAALASAWAFPSVRYRTELRERIATSLAGQPPRVRETVKESWKNWQVDRGAHINPERRPELGKGPFWNARYARSIPRKCDWRSEAYIARFLALAADYQIPVYWVLPPTHPEVLSNWDAAGATEFYTRFVHRMEQRFAGVTVVDARRSGHPGQRFYDSCHLDGPGALAFTAQVAEVLKQYPPRRGSPGRWVNVSADRIEMIARSPTRGDRSR